MVVIDRWLLYRNTVNNDHLIKWSLGTGFLKKSAWQIWHENYLGQNQSFAKFLEAAIIFTKLVEVGKHFTKFIKFTNNFIKFVQFANNFMNFGEFTNNFMKFVGLTNNLLKVVSTFNFTKLYTFLYLSFTCFKIFQLVSINVLWILSMFHEYFSQINYLYIYIYIYIYIYMSGQDIWDC